MSNFAVRYLLTLAVNLEDPVRGLGRAQPMQTACCDDDDWLALFWLLSAYFSSSFMLTDEVNLSAHSHKTYHRGLFMPLLLCIMVIDVQMGLDL